MQNVPFSKSEECHVFDAGRARDFFFEPNQDVEAKQNQGGDEEFRCMYKNPIDEVEELYQELINRPVR